MAEFKDIKGFVFDLDGVITDTSVFHSKAWHQLADKVGAPWDQKLEDGLKGISRMDSLDMILKAGNVTENYTQAEKESLAKEKNERYLNLVNEMTPANILPGIKEFLDELISNGYLISLASASKNSPTVLEKLGLTSYFPKVVDPASLKNGKPDPEIYIDGATLLGLKPEQAIGVEDAESGIQSINGAGETSIGIGKKENLKDADILFANTKELTLANIKKAMD